MPTFGDVVDFKESAYLAGSKMREGDAETGRAGFPETLHHVIIRGVEKKRVVDDRPVG
jgi:hypothetical protein